MARKRQYSRSEILAILQEETFSMRPDDIETFAGIFNYLTLTELARVAKAIKRIIKGGTY